MCETLVVLGQPKEGELHRRSPKYSTIKLLDQSVKSVNIDEPKGVTSMIQGLRLLWDPTL